MHWHDTVTWHPKVSADQFRKEHGECSEKFAVAADGKAYRLDYQGLNTKQFRHVLYLDDFEYNVMHPGVCAPRDKTVADVVLNIKTVHLTGFASAIRPGSLASYGFGGTFLEFRDYDTPGKCTLGDQGRPAYFETASSVKCTAILDYLGVMQTRFLFHGAKRTGLTLASQFC